MSGRGKEVERVCKCGCGVKFMARVADVKRGWGKFATKSCKAREQERRTGQHARHYHKVRDRHYRKEYGGTPQYDNQGGYIGFTMSLEELSSGGYGDADWDTPFGDGKW